MSQHILFLAGEVELMFQPDLSKLTLQFPNSGGISRILTDDERKRLIKALWPRRSKEAT